jgi:hypothetical protein
VIFCALDGKEGKLVVSNLGVKYWYTRNKDKNISWLMALASIVILDLS